MIKLQELQKLPTIVTSVTQSVRAKDEIKSQAQTMLTRRGGSKCPFGVFKSPKKTMKKFPGFLS